MMGIRYFLSLILVAGLLFLGSDNVFSQSVDGSKHNRSHIGENLSAQKFTTVLYGDTTVNEIKDFSGRWLIIDFFSRNCQPCIRDFPLLDKLNKEFSNDIGVLIVSLFGKYHYQPQGFTEGVRLAQGIALPVVFDSTFYKSIGIVMSSEVAVIDPSGRLVDIIFANEVNENFVRSLIRRRKLK